MLPDQRKPTTTASVGQEAQPESAPPAGLINAVLVVVALSKLALALGATRERMSDANAAVKSERRKKRESTLSFLNFSLFCIRKFYLLAVLSLYLRKGKPHSENVFTRLNPWLVLRKSDEFY